MTTNQTLQTTFANPPTEFGIIPFWFWNDDITEDELVRQIGAFHEKGFGGFMPHARTGLSRRVGYLTPEFFRLVKVAVEEAARLGLKVILYDEGSYPSGSAQGRVVAENPAYAARCLIAKQQQITGPAQGYWHPNPGRAMQDQLVCAVVGREIEPGVLDPTSLQVLNIEEPELVRYDLPAGNWCIVACWHVFSGGTIRGVFDEEEDGHAIAPAAGDILSPEAVACFIRHTHDQYYTHLAEHFGKTIVGLFTDEPSAMGRAVKRGPQPWPFTIGFLDDLQQGWADDVQRWLPALWLDCGPGTTDFRQHYERTVYDRMERVFYTAQHQWCQTHYIALTGHPHSSNEIGVLRQFQWPGQDTVWRWVLPNHPSALEGEHSTAPKCASSAAAIQGSRRNLTEPLGAYGWQLTLDEVKWLVDWHLVRGNNLFALHACFYSIRGRRAYESEPDIGLHNVWWPYFGLIAHYLRRLCWLLTDGIQICEVGILTDSNNVTWQAAKVLYQHQVDFIYLGPEHLEQADQVGDQLIIGQQHLRVLIFDPKIPLSKNQQAIVTQWQTAGGLLIDAWDSDDLIGQILAKIEPDVNWPNMPDVRYFHYHKDGREFYLFVNEGEQVCEGDLSVASIGQLTLWNPLDGTCQSWLGHIIGSRLHTHLRLERRQSLVLAIDPSGYATQDMPLPPQAGEVIAFLLDGWQIKGGNGLPVDLPALGNWAQVNTWALFSGRITYAIEFTLTDAQMGQPLFLDLGQVGDIAEVIINEQTAGVCAWAPYSLQIDRHCQAGANQLTIHVTNSMANAYEGLQRPSGLMGPVVIKAAV